MDTQVSNADKKLSNKYKSELPNEIIEDQTKKIPNLLFLGLSVASMIGAAALTASNSSKRKSLGSFVGLWAPTFLLFGLYNKMVKIEDEILRSKMH